LRFLLRRLLADFAIISNCLATTCTIEKVFDLKFGTGRASGVSKKSNFAFLRIRFKN
jgi:hypothetical protein